MGRMLAQKRHELLDPEIGQHMAVPVECRSLALARERDHFLHGLAVARDYDRVIADALAIEIRSDFFAPWAGDFDVESRTAHRGNCCCCCFWC